MVGVDMIVIVCRLLHFFLAKTECMLIMYARYMISHVIMNIVYLPEACYHEYCLSVRGTRSFAMFF